ncbi:Uncharacterised protein [Mycobacteroides abscessus subsp. abscessus]|nr:Uncharacterised protein [Mycobacteroides abscessus subsp. abscessus]
MFGNIGGDDIERTTDPHRYLKRRLIGQFGNGFSQLGA